MKDEETTMAQPGGHSRDPAAYNPMKPLPFLIFSSRWLQLPLYLGLIIAQCVYVFLFLKELWHLHLRAGAAIDRDEDIPLGLAASFDMAT